MARLNKANIPVSAKQASKSVLNGTYVFDNVSQRSLVWEQSRKSNLIHSMIEGYPIPPFYAQKLDGKYSFLDGKQRMNTIKEFINNEFFLIDTPEVEVENEDGTTELKNLDGFYFKDLPEDLQDEIKDYHLTIYYYENITDEQVRILFAKLNNGKPLSTKDRNIANCVDIVTVADIGKHELFENILTEKALASRKHLPIIMKMWMMLNTDIEDVSFESKVFNDEVKEIKISDSEKEEIIDVLDKIFATYKSLEEYPSAKVAKVVRKKMTSETHMISLIPFFKRAIDDGITDKVMGDFMVELFGHDVLVSDVYAESCKGGSAKGINVNRRNDEIEKAWDAFFAEDIDDNDFTEYNDEDFSGENEENRESENEVYNDDNGFDGSMNEPEIEIA